MGATGGPEVGARESMLTRREACGVLGRGDVADIDARLSLFTEVSDASKELISPQVSASPVPPPFNHNSVVTPNEHARARRSL